MDHQITVAYGVKAYRPAICVRFISPPPLPLWKRVLRALTPDADVVALLIAIVVLGLIFAETAYHVVGIPLPVRTFASAASGAVIGSVLVGRLMRLF